MEIENDENVVQNKAPFTYGSTTRKTTSTTKKITRVAEPHIEAYIPGGRDKSRIYYRYRRGTDKPIHLGTADAILAAVGTVRNIEEIRRLNSTKYTTDKNPASLFKDRG